MTNYKKLFSNPEKQKDWERYLTDPNIPTDIIDSIVKDIVLEKLKIILMSHPNISLNSIIFLINNTLNFSYYKTLVKLFITNHKDLDTTNWLIFTRASNNPKKLNEALIALIKENDDTFSTNILDIIFNVLTSRNTFFYDIIKCIVNHKNFKEYILEGKLIQTYKYLLYTSNSHLFKILYTSNKSGIICNKMFDLTHDIMWLNSEAKDVFLF